MATNFVEELRWRGLTTTLCLEQKTTEQGNDGRLHWLWPHGWFVAHWSLVQIMTLVHYQPMWTKPIAPDRRCDRMVGDPSGKVRRAESLLSENYFSTTRPAWKASLKSFLTLRSARGQPSWWTIMYWFKEFLFIDFIRDVGKHMTVNYMMSKDSVQRRLRPGISFTEFSSSLSQGYDFYWLLLKQKLPASNGRFFGSVGVISSPARNWSEDWRPKRLCADTPW